MRDDLKGIWRAVRDGTLPSSVDELIAGMIDPTLAKFTTQETHILDYKDRVPDRWSDEFGYSIIRLCCGFHNSFGGIIIFGIDDKSRSPSGLSIDLDIENLNSVFNDLTEANIELIYRSYFIESLGKELGFLLVPKRGNSIPISLKRDMGKNRKGTLWIRERHEVVAIQSRHFPMLYSSRDSLPGDLDDYAAPAIQRSLPPSPAMTQKFVGRSAKMKELWDWAVFGDQPRAYLFGEGGSGKSTLAFEFARLASEPGHRYVLRNGASLDYVIYLSAKETELDPITNRQKTFVKKQFEDVTTQLREILISSGVTSSDEVNDLPPERLEDAIDELFANFTGLIVLDDIDALSRRGVDTGEEMLLIKAVSAARRTKILYTLRYPPAHARKSAIEVPGLPDDEFYEFLEVVCEQMEVPPPTAEIMPLIQEETSSIPLLIENVVGLRKHCGNFRKAIEQHRDKGGDDARRYLYQREYDELSRKGRSREVLAALALFEEPVRFSTLPAMLGFSAQIVSDAISESGSIFLTTSEDRTGETIYQLSKPSRPFIIGVSTNLSVYEQIYRKVQLFKRERTNSKEYTLISKLLGHLARKEFNSVVDLARSIPPTDPSLANPKVRSAIGQGYANCAKPDLVYARECFEFADSMNYFDIFMMRSWFYVEDRTGYGATRAKEVCDKVIVRDKLSPTYAMEFWNKKGFICAKEGRALMPVNKDKGIAHYQESIGCYLESFFIAKSNQGADKALDWFDRTVNEFVNALRGDFGPYFEIFEKAADTKHDISKKGAAVLFRTLHRCSFLPFEQRGISRFLGVIRKTESRMAKLPKYLENEEGFRYVRNELAALRFEYDRKATPT